MMAANFGQKIVISMKSSNMPVPILPKQTVLMFYVYL